MVKSHPLVAILELVVPECTTAPKPLATVLFQALGPVLVHQATLVGEQIFLSRERLPATGIGCPPASASHSGSLIRYPCPAGASPAVGQAVPPSAPPSALASEGSGGVTTPASSSTSAHSACNTAPLARGPRGALELPGTPGPAAGCSAAEWAGGNAMFWSVAPRPSPTRGGVQIVDISGAGGATGGSGLIPRPLLPRPTGSLPRALALASGNCRLLGSISAN